MKRVLYKLSIIFPLLLIYYSFTESVSFEEIKSLEAEETELMKELFGNA